MSRRTAAFTLAALLMAARVQAAELEARLDRQRIAPGETVTLLLQLRGGTEAPDVEKLVSALSDATAASQNLDNNFASMSRDERMQASQELFDSLAAAGGAVAALGPDHRQVRNRLDELSQMLRLAPPESNQGIVLEYLGRQALTSKSTKPIVLLGVVEIVGKDGDKPIVRLKVKDHSVLVLAAADHDGSFSAADSIYVVGRRLPPAEHQRDGEAHVVQASLIVHP